MRCRLQVALAAATWLALTSPAWTQEAVRWEKGLPVKAWVAYAGCTPLASPSPTADKKERPQPIKFLEMFYVADKQQQYWYLVRAAQDEKTVVEKVGWVLSSYLVTEAEAQKDPDTQVYRKAMIVNTAEQIRKSKQVILDQSLPIRHAPLAEAPAAEAPARLFTIYFVWGEADGHVLLGGKPSFNEAGGADEARQCVLGWVPQERACRWNTRQATYWDYRSTLPNADPRRTTRGRIFPTPDDALAGVAKPDVRTLFLEPWMEGVSPKPPPDEVRYPLLPWKDLGDKARPAKDFNDPLQGRLLHVGVVGGFRQGGDTKDVLTKDQVARFEKAIGALDQEVSEAEILFVIDDTDSMKDWFKRVADTFDAILAEMTKDPQRRVRIGVTWYNDVTETNKDPVNQECPLKDAKEVGKEYADKVRGHQYKLGGDPREMVYRGIFEALDKTPFSDHARKMVIVIGDCGDRDDDDPKLKEPKEPAFEGYLAKYGLEKIVDKLLPAEDASPVEFYCIQVADPARDGDTRAFHDQMNALKDLLQRKGKAHERDIPAGYFQVDDRPEQVTLFRKHVAERYHALRKDQDEFKRKLGGFAVQLKAEFSPEQERVVKQRLDELKDPELTYEKLRNLKGFQLFEEGYVWEKEVNVSLVTPYLFLNDAELDDVIKVFERLPSPIVAKRPTLPEMLLALVKTMVGEQGANDAELKHHSVNDVLRKRFGLEFNSEFMKKPIAEVETSPRLDPNNYHYLMHRVQVLKEIRRGECFEYESYTDDEGGVPVKKYRQKANTAPDRRDRFFHMPGDPSTRWYWIDQDTEWP